MSWRWYDCESDAQEARAFGFVGQEDDLRARDIGAAMGLRFSRCGVCGCGGVVDLNELHVYSSGCGHLSTRNFNDAHEILHVIQTLNDAEPPHDEDRVDWGAVALLMPRGRVLRTVGRLGLYDLNALLDAFPLVPPAWVLLRVAWVARRPVALFMRGERWVWAPEGYRVPDRSTWWELRLKRLVRATGLPEKSIQGAYAVPVGRGTVEGVLMFYPKAEPDGW